MTAQHHAFGQISTAPGPVHRMQAFFHGQAYAPHRHDTYTFGLTTRGVQSFDYRGSARHSLPGELVVLHPDELHDGRAGTEDGFAYRSISIEPSAIQAALNGKPLPFVPDGVSRDPRLIAVVAALLRDFDHALHPLEYEDVIFDLAAVLGSIGESPDPSTSRDYIAAESARDYVHAHLGDKVSMDDLEAATGRDRWQLARDFRAFFGTSPYRYLMMRRIDQAKSEILAGRNFASTAYASGFADQSHLNRQFKQTVGLTPKAWKSVMLQTRPTGRTIVQ
jgi:AraC-like DNA-binding protein